MLGVGARDHRAGVAAAPRLGQRERRELVALGERRHEPLDLLVRAVREDRQRARAGVHGDGDPDAGVSPRELLEHQDVAEEVGAGATDLVGDADAHQAELAELGEHVPGKDVLAIPLRRPRGDDVVGEARGELADLALLVGELVAAYPSHSARH